MYLAQLNIAKLKHPAGDPRVAEFFDNTERINALAARSPGFVWRKMDANEHVLAKRFFGTGAMTFTLSVWKDAQSLEDFVWKTVHRQFYAKRNDWFETLDSHHLVMWNVKQGAFPDMAEAASRLCHLDRHGSSEHAFDWAYLKAHVLWSEQRPKVYGRAVIEPGETSVAIAATGE